MTPYLKRIRILILSLFHALAFCIAPHYVFAAEEKPVPGTAFCPLPEVDEAAKAEKEKPPFEVYSPVAESSVKPVKQAARLKTLDGKTIAVVGGSFMANVTHPEIKRLILENYPTAKVILLSEIGSAGPYPAPGVIRREKDEFQRRLKEMKVDAVISGNGGCGLCTPKEEGSCITAELMSIPSVMITAPGFADQAKFAAAVAGVSVQRIAEYPGAFSSHTRDELLKNTKEVLWPQIVQGLTKPITATEQKNQTKLKQSDKVAYAGTYDAVNAYFEKQGWSDGLPIVPPTKKLIDEFFKYTPYKPDSVIGRLPVAYRNVTAFQVAVVGAMAGCPPEYMPYLIAFAKAMADGNFRKTLSSTHAWSPFVWLNGPAARQLGFDSGQGEITSPKNKKIGRFIDLALINLGGYDVKKTRMGTFGYLSSWCLMEDEKAVLDIGWKTYHQQKGFSLNDNAITAASSLSWGNNLTPASSNPQKIMELMAWDAVEKEQFALGGGTPFVYRTILITEYVAKDLAKKYTDKESLEKALIKTARRPLEERAYANYWANPGSSFEGKNYTLENHTDAIAADENAAQTAIPPWLAWTGKDRIDTVPVMQAGKTAIIVTGDASRNKVLTVPGGGMATIAVELPKNWDKLMKAKGYKPISSFYIKENPAKKAAIQTEPEYEEEPEHSTMYQQKRQNPGQSRNGYGQRGQRPGQNGAMQGQRSGQNRPSGQYGSKGGRRPGGNYGTGQRPYGNYRRDNQQGSAR